MNTHWQNVHTYIGIINYNIYLLKLYIILLREHKYFIFKAIATSYNSLYTQMHTHILYYIKYI